MNLASMCREFVNGNDRTEDPLELDGMEVEVVIVMLVAKSNVEFG